MIEIISAFAKTILERGYDSLLEHKGFKRLVGAIKEQIRRELRLNVEIIDESFSAAEVSGKSIEPNKNNTAFGLIKTSTFDSISKGAIPLSVLLSEEIDVKVYPKTNAQYIKYCAKDKKIFELIERTYFRLEVAKAYSQIPNSKIDIGYVKFLMISSIKALK